MPKIYTRNDNVRDYTIIDEVSRGMMAVAYRARAADGQEVFLKQYKSPTIRVAWYKEYKKYQQQLKYRIENSACKNFCYRFVDVFEFERCFFQAFEFLDQGQSLEVVLETCRKNPRHVTGAQRLIMAKVLMGGINALHGAKIVHSDLKPANIMLIKDREILAGYRLRIIDMDFSLLVDQQAPWHGVCGYFGTPGYLSPEHLDGEVPQPASDVFTLGLMLHELLGNKHPYPFEDENRYKVACKSHAANEIELFDDLAKLSYADKIREAVHACLTPDKANRPTPLAVNLILNGCQPSPASGGTAEAKPPSNVNAQLTLRGDSGEEVVFNLGTSVGRRIINKLGKDAMYFDEPQFTLAKEEAGWFVVPNSSAKNATFLNDKPITTRTRLKDGDLLAIGNKETMVTKLPMRVCINSVG